MPEAEEGEPCGVPLLGTNCQKSRLLAENERLRATLLRAEADKDEAVTHIKTAIGSLDDPTGPHVVEDVRRVRDVVLLDALNALYPMSQLREAQTLLHSPSTTIEDDK